MSTSRDANPLESQEISSWQGKLEQSVVSGISLRPMGERLTLSAQAESFRGEKPDWMFGGRISPLKGIELFGTFRRDFSRCGAEPYEEYSLGMSLALGSGRIRTQGRMPVDAKPEYGLGTNEQERIEMVVHRLGEEEPEPS